MATICTDEFAFLAQAEVEVLGMPGLPLVVIPHPIGGIGRDDVREKGDLAAEEVVQALTRSREDLYRIHKGRKIEITPRMRYKPLFR